MHVSTRTHITLAFLLAALATVLGWWQSLHYKVPPPVPLALWFPLIVITGTRELGAVALSLIQFPLFAFAFTFGIRRWPVGRVLVVIALSYALLAGIALAIVTSR